MKDMTEVTISMDYGEDEWETVMTAWEQELSELVGEGSATVIEPSDDITYGREIMIHLTVTPEIAHALKMMLKIFYGLDSPMAMPSTGWVVTWEENIISVGE